MPLLLCTSRCAVSTSPSALNFRRISGRSCGCSSAANSTWSSSSQASGKSTASRTLFGMQPAGGSAPTQHACEQCIVAMACCTAEPESGGLKQHFAGSFMTGVPHRRCRDAGGEVIQRRLAQQAGAAREVQDVVHKLRQHIARFFRQVLLSWKHTQVAHSHHLTCYSACLDRHNICRERVRHSTWKASPRLRPYSQAVAAVSRDPPPRMATALQLLAMRLAVL